MITLFNKLHPVQQLIVEVTVTVIACVAFFQAFTAVLRFVDSFMVY